MEENKRSVMVAALSAYADLLAHNATQLNNAQGKGKGKASEDDVDLESEIQDQIKVCRDLSSSFANPPPPDERLATQQDYRGDQANNGLNPNDQKLLSQNPFTCHEDSDDEDPIFDPFTGRLIIRETGFEAGPSNRPQTRLLPPTLDTISFLTQDSFDTSSNPMISLLDSEPVVEIQPPPKNSQLTKPHDSPDKPVGEIVLSPSLLLNTTRQDKSEIPEGTRAFPRELRNGLARTDTIASIRRKPLPGRHEVGLLSSQSSMSRALSTEATQNLKPIEGSSAGRTVPEYEDSSSIVGDKQHKGSNSSRVSDFISVTHVSALMYIANYSQKMKYFGYITKLASNAMKKVVGMKAPSLTESPTRAEYDSRSLSLSPERYSSKSMERPLSRSERALRRIPSQETLPPAYETLAPASRRASLASMYTYPSIETLTPGSHTRDDISPTLRNRTISQSTQDYGDLREHYMRGDIPSLIPDRTQKDQPTLGTNNPWRRHILADEALAKAIQQEEYRQAQAERDLLLAYALSNSTADDDDVELAYFMSKNTDILIESAESTLAATTMEFVGRVNNDALGTSNWNREETSARLDPGLKRVEEIQRHFAAQDEAFDASLVMARKLQAEYEQHAQDEEAWENWKKGNIDECVVCGDEHGRDELLRPCKHGYCDSCLQDGFKNALSSRAPLRCCDLNLNVDECIGLDDEFVEEYQELMLELTTPNPIYCSNRRCAKFLPPRVWVADVASCVNCRAQTCKYCRQKHHPGKFCPEDKETERVKELGKSKGWKTCPGCNHLIERIQGCLHMVCSRCQTAFCYRCSKRWKDCESTCPDRKSSLQKTVDSVNLLS
jgi:hypothetical protein